MRAKNISAVQKGKGICIACSAKTRCKRQAIAKGNRNKCVLRQFALHEHTVTAASVQWCIERALPRCTGADLQRVLQHACCNTHAATRMLSTSRFCNLPRASVRVVCLQSRLQKCALGEHTLEKKRKKKKTGCAFRVFLYSRGHKAKTVKAEVRWHMAATLFRKTCRKTERCDVRVFILQNKKCRGC